MGEVERYEIEGTPHCAWRRDDGEWVRAEAYDELRARVADLETMLTHPSPEEDRLRARVAELEGGLERVDNERQAARAKVAELEVSLAEAEANAQEWCELARSHGLDMVTEGLQACDD